MSKGVGALYYLLRRTLTTVEPLRVSPPEAVAYQFESATAPRGGGLMKAPRRGLRLAESRYSCQFYLTEEKNSVADFPFRIKCPQFSWTLIRGELRHPPMSKGVGALYYLLRRTLTTVEPLRVSPPEAVAYQFELVETLHGP